MTYAEWNEWRRTGGIEWNEWLADFPRIAGIIQFGFGSRDDYINWALENGYHVPESIATEYKSRMAEDQYKKRIKRMAKGK